MDRLTYLYLTSLLLQEDLTSTPPPGGPYLHSSSRRTLPPLLLYDAYHVLEHRTIISCHFIRKKHNYVSGLKARTKANIAT
jgi:hypothetical protein